MMTTVWKLDAEFYVLYTEDKDIMNRVKRYYKDFEQMASYSRQGEIYALQYKVPLKRKRVAFRLANLHSPNEENKATN
jgi:hypothetical protein